MSDTCRYKKVSNGYRSECGHTIKSVSHTFKVCPFCGKKYIRDRKNYYQENTERIKAYARDYRKNHPEQVKAYQKKWREANPDYFKKYALTKIVNYEK